MRIPPAASAVAEKGFGGRDGRLGGRISRLIGDHSDGMADSKSGGGPPHSRTLARRPGPQRVLAAGGGWGALKETLI